MTEPCPASRPRVLVVEDNPVNRRVARGLLERIGCEVFEAEHGEAALTHLRCSKYDVVFMDMQMPVLDGYEAMRRIRSDPRWTGLPIIAMTAHALKGDRERCLECGASDYLAKPVRSEDLVAAIRRHVSSVSPSAAESTVKLSPVARRQTEKSAPMDMVLALEQMDGDSGLLDIVLDACQTEFPRLTVALQAAIERSDMKAVQFAAHSVKGSASNICAGPARDAAIRLECVAKEGSPDALRAPAQDLLNRLDELQGFLATLVKSREDGRG